MIEVKFYLSESIRVGKLTEGLRRGKDSEGIYFSLNKLVPETPSRLKKFPIRKVVIEHTDAVITNVIEGEHNSTYGWACVYATKYFSEDECFATIYVSAKTYEDAFSLLSIIRSGRLSDVPWNILFGISEDNFSGIMDMTDSSFGYLFEDDDDDDEDEEW